MNVIEWIVLIFLILVCGWLLWLLRKRSQREMVAREQQWLERHDDDIRTLLDFNETVKSSLPPEGEVRYEIRLADWGPDFTGYDGTLPRWRWSVVDADRALKDALGLMDEIGTDEVPFMLGNDFYPETAMLEAYRWAEAQQHPPLSVVMGKVEQ